LPLAVVPLPRIGMKDELQFLSGSHGGYCELCRNVLRDARSLHAHLLSDHHRDRFMLVIIIGLFVHVHMFLLSDIICILRAYGHTTSFCSIVIIKYTFSMD